MTTVETDHIAGQQSPHESREGNFTGPEKKVGMIREKCPGLASRLCFQQKLTQPFKKILSIAMIPEDLSAFNAPDDDMLNNFRSVKTS